MAPAAPPSALDAALAVWSRAACEHGLPSEGTSMLPLILSGDTLLVRHGDEGIGRGDVIAFRRGGRLIAHRVVYTWRDEAGPVYLTRGDNLIAWDVPVPLAGVVGQVVAISRPPSCTRLDRWPWRPAGVAVALLAAACRKAGALTARLLPAKARPGYELRWAGLARTLSAAMLRGLARREKG